MLMICLVRDPLLLPHGGKEEVRVLAALPPPLGAHSDRGSPGLTRGNIDPFPGAVATLSGFLHKASWVLGSGKQ